MRARAYDPKKKFSVHAIAGTHVVLLGMDVKPTDVDGLLGFAIHREDHTEGEAYWLRNFLTFRETDSGAGYGPHYLTIESPIQEFNWGDYTAKPNHRYTYRVMALFGQPKKLEARFEASVTITTEDTAVGSHSVLFNRGVAASQAYVRHFQNRAPGEVPYGRAYRWLSRGLVEGLHAFIGEAKDSSYALRASVYEFRHLDTLKQIKLAHERGVDVKVIYDARDSDVERRNEAAIIDADLPEAVCVPRESNSSYISHNKFVVLLHLDEPVAVWTGSTNLSEGGLYGHSNVGHIVRDPKIAKMFLEYWEELAEDPPAAALRKWNDTHSKWSASAKTIFSPRSSLEVLEKYAELMESAKSGVFMTAAFGVHELFRDVLREDRTYLRYILLERDSDDLEVIKRDPDNRITYGAKLGTDAFSNWAREKLTGLNGHVQYIHTKYMLIDPLGPNPVVVTGSANFSAASTKNNDENMLIIRDEPSVADMYLTEFMRLFTHFEFRARTQERRATSDVSGSPTSRPRLHLKNSDVWARRFYVPDSVEQKERELFA